MVKRLMREAAMAGYDKLAWTPGWMQQRRWKSGHIREEQQLDPKSGYAIAYDGHIRRAVEKMGKPYGATVRKDDSLSDFTFATTHSATVRAQMMSLKTLVERTVAAGVMPQTWADQMLANGQLSEQGRVNNIVYSLEKIPGALEKVMPEAFKTDAVWSIDITPDLRAAASLAQPMFQRQTTNPQLVRDARAAAWEIQQAMPALRRELDRLDLRRVTLRQAPDMTDQGRIDYGPDGITITIGAALDPARTLYHEVIHALYMSNLFTPQEWAALSHAAEKWLTKHDIPSRYPNLTHAEQIEEAIAEEFGAAMTARKAPDGSLLITAFNKIARFLKALRNVMNGRGFQTAEDIFGRVYSAEIGARRADNTGEWARIQPRFQRGLRPLTAQGRAHRNTGMMGSLFIPDRRVWETLTDTSKPVWQRLRETPAAMGDAVDRARLVLQDRMLPILRAQESITASGGTITPEQNAYIAETTFSGKVGKHLYDIDEELTKPAIKIIAGSKGRMTTEDVGQWLYARHAVERNAWIASINPQMPDGGSGMENAEAQAILAQVAASQDAARFNEIGRLVDVQREKSLQLREITGLITHDDADRWRRQYKHYVPLKGFGETDNAEAVLDVTGIGRRLNVRGQESKRALGRESEAFNPLQGAITQAQEVAIRAEKNRVGNAIYQLAVKHPSKALWSIKKHSQKRYFNRTTGLVETRVEDPVTMILEPNEMAVKVNGREVRILFHDERLAQAAGTVGADQMGAIMRTLSLMSRFFSMTRTMLNPEFMLTNAFRDFQTAQFNVQGMDKGMRGRIALAMTRDWRKAMLGAMRGQTHRYDTEWSKHFRDFQNAGAQVSFWTMENPEVARADLDRRIALARGGRAVRALKVMTSPRALFSMRDNAVLDFIDRANLSVDNAIRLAAFVEARKAGMDVEKAAFMAKELTVNFNRRGDIGPHINALYPFFNAAIQGGVRTVKALTSRRVGILVMMAFAAGALNDLLNAMLSEEDDDGELFYDKIPDYRSQRNFHLVLWGTGNNPVAIPMPYGYNLFPYAGQQLGKVIRGVKSPDAAFGDVMAAAFGAFSPISGGDANTLVAPFFVDPLMEMAENKTFTGAPIYPPYPKEGVPDSHGGLPSGTAASKFVAEGLNSLTGGDFRQSGAVDINPETIDYLSAFVGGSAAAFWGRTFDIVAKTMSGHVDQIEQRDVPFLRNVTSPVGEFQDQDRFYRFTDEVRDAHADALAYAEAGLPVPSDVAKKDALYEAVLEANRELKGQGIWNASKSGALAPRAKGAVYLDFNGKFIALMGHRAE
jgi:hypothetical protein